MPEYQWRRTVYHHLMIDERIIGVVFKFGSDWMWELHYPVVLAYESQWENTQHQAKAALIAAYEESKR